MKVYVVTETQDNSRDADTNVSGVFKSKLRAEKFASACLTSLGDYAYRWTVQVHEQEVMD